MKSPPFERMISISQLLLDVQNPRLPDIQDSQHDAIKNMASTQGDKILVLAEHLVEHGPNPASIPVVIPTKTDVGMYYVLDGNRRITALKLLETPTLANGVFNNTNLKKLKQMSAEFEQNPITDLNCVVVSSREEADTWIQLIHRGQQKGAGLVEWDGQVAARYDSRKNKKPNMALDILDYAKNNASLSETTIRRINSGKFPITNLQRLLNTPYVRKKLGIDTGNDGDVVFVYPEEEVQKGLSRVIDDLGEKRITVSNIKNQEQRIDYINGLSREELPEVSTMLPSPVQLDKATISAERAGKSSKKKRKSEEKNRYRTTLIPRTCTLKISHHRIEKIYNELKQLNIDDFPNSGSVMLRVFVELSLDHCLEHIIIWDEQKISNSSLAQKLTGVANYFESNQIMTTSQLLPIKKAAGGQTLLSASIKTMHGYVHNRHFSPVSSELKTAWDDFQPFMENIWPE